MAATSPYPDNDRSEWVIVPLDTPYRDSAGLLCWSYAVYASLASQQGGDLPFLYNSHKATIRENHQRQAEAPDGRLRHVSGELVARQDTEDFLTNEAAAYRWVERWRDDRGRELTPFNFPTYQGDVEELDPQWERDQYAISEDSQRIATQDSYLEGVHERHTSGDRRGTTLNLQVSASSDDCSLNSGANINLTDTQSPYWLGTSVTRGWGARFLSVSIANSSTIDVAYLTYTPLTSVSDPSQSVAVKADDTDDAATFSTYANFTGRTQTTASLSYAVPAQTGNTPINTGSIVSIIQEVVNRSGWSSGNALAILQSEASVGTEDPTAHSYDSDTAKAGKLHIQYSAPPPTDMMFLMFPHVS
jgi:hypothetical protein